VRCVSASQALRPPLVGSVGPAWAPGVGPCRWGPEPSFSWRTLSISVLTRPIGRVFFLWRSTSAGPSSAATAMNYGRNGLPPIPPSAWRGTAGAATQRVPPHSLLPRPGEGPLRVEAGHRPGGGGTSGGPAGNRQVLLTPCTSVVWEPMAWSARSCRTYTSGPDDARYHPMRRSRDAEPVSTLEPGRSTRMRGTFVPLMQDSHSRAWICCPRLAPAPTQDNDRWPEETSARPLIRQAPRRLRPQTALRCTKLRQPWSLVSRVSSLLYPCSALHRRRSTSSRECSRSESASLRILELQWQLHASADGCHNGEPGKPSRRRWRVLCGTQVVWQVCEIASWLHRECHGSRPDSHARCALTARPVPRIRRLAPRRRCLGKAQVVDGQFNGNVKNLAVPGPFQHLFGEPVSGEITGKRGETSPASVRPVPCSVCPSLAEPQEAGMPPGAPSTTQLPGWGVPQKRQESRMGWNSLALRRVDHAAWHRHHRQNLHPNGLEMGLGCCLVTL